MNTAASSTVDQGVPDMMDDPVALSPALERTTSTAALTEQKRHEDEDDDDDDKEPAYFCNQYYTRHCRKLVKGEDERCFQCYVHMTVNDLPGSAPKIPNEREHCRDVLPYEESSHTPGRYTIEEQHQYLHDGGRLLTRIGQPTGAMFTEVPFSHGYVSVEGRGPNHQTAIASPSMMSSTSSLPTVDERPPTPFAQVVSMEGENRIFEYRCAGARKYACKKWTDAEKQYCDTCLQKEH